jgi:hypothetical protein
MLPAVRASASRPGSPSRRDPARPDLRPQQAAEQVGLLFGPLVLRAGGPGAGIERLFQQ